MAWDPSVWAQAPPAIWSYRQEGSEERAQRQPGRMEGAVLLPCPTAAPSPSEEEQAPLNKQGQREGSKVPYQ